MKRQEWPHDKMEGVDADIETSLKEYGLAWIEGETETMFYYGLAHDMQDGFVSFDFCTIANDLAVHAEYDWIDEWEGVYSFTGMTEEEWNAMPLPSKIQDLVQYYGRENIFGSSYWEGLTYEEVTEPK